LRPAHALAMAPSLAQGAWSGPRLELSGDDGALESYRQGGAVAAAGVPDGYALVTHGGFALGWAACRGGTARSLLPRGLRRAPWGPRPSPGLGEAAGGVLHSRLASSL